MGKERTILQRISDETNMVWPGVTLIELMEDSRLLVENHFGVAEYSQEKMRINTTFGQVIICGSNLDLQRMTKDQLIIRGNIQSVQTVKGCRHE